MNKIAIFILGVLVQSFLLAQQNTQQIVPCITYDAMEYAFQQDPEAKARYEAAQKELEEAYKNYEASLKLHQGKTAAFQYTIPVVFHVLHTNGPENISDATLINALAQVNKDYARQGSDTGTIYSAFKSLYINSDIVFMLAHKDPSGNCTNGIVHYYNTNTNWVQSAFPYPYTWNPTKYLNIYIVKEICQSAPNCSTSGGVIVGYTYLPGTWSSGSSRDAIVYNYQFLSGTQARSLSHEIGHWLNLKHTFGNTNNPGVSCGDDGITDTPVTKGYYSTCPGGNAGPFTGCSNPENIENIMDYSSCPKMFTTGQTNAMRSALASSVSGRNNLSSSSNITATGVNDTATCYPIAYGYSNTYTVCSGGAITVTDKSYNGPVASRTWAATGGATIANPSATVTNITFPNMGVQTVSLTTCNFAGCTTYTFSVNVLDGTPNVTASYVESFEGSTSTPPNWSIINGSGGTTWQVYTGGGATGTNAMFIDGSLEPAGVQETLETPSYDFLNNPNATFTFKYAYAQETSAYSDKLIVQASSNCGGTWTNVYQPAGSTLSSGSGGVTSSPFYPTPSQFKLYTLTSNPAFTTFKTQPNVKIRFIFQTDDGFGNNFFLDDINFSVPTGVNELTQSISLNVHPNPTNGKVSIHFILSDVSTIHYQVTDILGKTIVQSPQQKYDTGEHTIDLNLQHLPQGVYFLQLEMNGQKMVRKVLKTEN